MNHNLIEHTIKHIGCRRHNLVVLGSPNEHSYMVNLDMNTNIPMQSIVGALKSIYIECNGTQIMVPSGVPTIYCDGSHNTPFITLTEEQERSMMSGSKILRIQIISIIQTALNTKREFCREPTTGLEPRYADEIRRHLDLMKEHLDTNNFYSYLVSLSNYFFRLHQE